MKSLADYFPAHTVYFYGYPSGLASGFLNRVTPDVEEIVAARPNTCAGDEINIINFAATVPNDENRHVFESVGLPERSTSNIIMMPEEITFDIQGAPRNALVKQFLQKLPKCSLVMAQPFTDSDTEDVFLIPPQITAWLNDKKNMMEYIDDILLPKKYGVFSSGNDLIGHLDKISVPVVIKATSSSAGDGVYICRTEQQLESACEVLKSYDATVTAEQFVEAKHNCGVQFGITQKGDIEIISVSEQITSDDGEFLGGIFDPSLSNTGIEQAKQTLRESILPFVFKKGWFGIGCFDILIDKNDQPYFIDANFRMTGMSAMLFYALNNPSPLKTLSLGAVYEATNEDFVKHIAPLTTKNNGWLHILTLSQNGSTWRFNACFRYDSSEDLRAKADILRATGMQSGIFEFL